MPLIVVTEPIPAEPLAWLGERGEVVEAAPGGARFGGLLARAAGLVVRTHTRVDAAMLDAAPDLRVVGRAGVGVDNIDLEACKARGVAVVHTPEANTDAVVSYVWSWVLRTLRPVTVLDGAVSEDRWHGLRREVEAPRELSDLTLGVYGFGRIGSRVGRAGEAFGMHVIYHDLREIEGANGAVAVSRDELLARADVLTIHVDGRPGNRGLIDADALGHLKGDAILVNTSRGMVVDEPALAAFLGAHPRARALLDVHADEPVSAASPLAGLANAELSPHVAAATVPAKERMGWVVADIWRVLEGHEPAFRVV